MKTSGATSADGYLVFLERNAMLRNVTLEECDGSDRNGGFVHLRNVESVLLEGSRYQNGGKLVDAAGCYGIVSESANVSDSAEIDIPDMTREFGIDGPSGSKNVHGIWLRNP